VGEERLLLKYLGRKGGADVKNEEGEERHGCWVIDAPGGQAQRHP